MSQTDVDRYHQAMHAVQSAIAFEMNSARVRSARHPETEPKHLRVGINAAMVNDGAVATLLIVKGLITKDEYEAALADFAEHELSSYQRRNPGVTFA